MKKSHDDRAGCDWVHRDSDTRIERGRFNRHRVRIPRFYGYPAYYPYGYYPYSYYPYGAAYYRPVVYYGSGYRPYYWWHGRRIYYRHRHFR